MSDGPRFAHASEAELARILEYYQVRWEYEPRVFPVRWNLEGAVVESFAPDFFLPELDLYIELTTLKQSLVRRKNRKLRRLRELYPMLRVKLLYAKDFRALLLKYGRIDVAASLIGIEGQVRPETVAAITDEEPAAVAASLGHAASASHSVELGPDAASPAPANGRHRRTSPRPRTRPARPARPT